MSELEMPERITQPNTNCTDSNCTNSDSSDAIDAIPLCVDLDGSLILTDTLYEGVALLIKHNWLYCFLLPFWLYKGKAHLKTQIARRVQLQIDRLPVHQPFLSWCKAQAKAGRELILVTGTHETIAKPIAQHLGIFKNVIATSNYSNCTSQNKADQLIELYGPNGFDYAGNSQVDLKIWAHARRAIVVNATDKTLSQAQEITTVEIIHPHPAVATFKTYLKAFRVHQWMKNLLIFVPLLTAHLYTSTAELLSASLAFILMSVCASATYIINDLLDLEADRAHRTKCERPFAAGKISILDGAITAIVLLATAFGLSALIMPYDFTFILMSYLVITLTYSLAFKRLHSIDVVTLALLYTIRVLAGAAAIGVMTSFWLLAFSLFLFLSLGLVKRVSEIQKLIHEDKTSIEGRGYQINDLNVLQTLGGSAGYIAVLVIALYIHNPNVSTLYTNPELLWTICPILTVWITRMWLLTSRGEVNEDPVEYAIKDKFSWLVLVLCIGIILLAGAK